MESNYEKLLEFIEEHSSVDKAEIERRIEAKQSKLAGLISKEGAAQVIAAELGVSFDKQAVKISQIVPGMKKINLHGKIIDLFPIREFNKNGRQGRVANFILADDTSNTRIVLWDENHIDLVEKGEIKQEDFVEVNNASVRNGEIHLNSFAEIKPSDKKIENVVTEKLVFKKKIIDFNFNDRVSTRAFVVQMFEPRFFEVCPECRKKVEGNECKKHGKVVPEKRALLNFVIDDGTDSIRATMFSDSLKKIISMEELQNLEQFAVKKNDLLGKEVLVSGQVRRNKMFNNKDFIVNDISDIELDELIKELEK